MSQNLKNVSYKDECYTIIFITVSSHNGNTFSFINQLNNRFEFFQDRWKKWKNILQPYSTHAFLVNAYNARSDSGMSFKPAMHLATFLNIEEARVFNSAYLLTYNKLLGESNVDELNEFTVSFGDALLDMNEMRSNWLSVCEKSAAAVFNKDVMDAFGFGPPTYENIFNQAWKGEFIIDQLDWNIGVEEESE